jgi:hypothetical protein
MLAGMYQEFRKTESPDRHLNIRTLLSRIAWNNRIQTTNTTAHLSLDYSFGLFQEV